MPAGLPSARQSRPADAGHHGLNPFLAGEAASVSARIDKPALSTALSFALPTSFLPEERHLAILVALVEIITSCNECRGETGRATRSMRSGQP
jgi:hypothetical protein